MLRQEHIDLIKQELECCQRPIFFFHDDCDGSTSYIQLYHHKGEGKGVIIKAAPLVDVKYARKVQEYGADKVFILDIAMVDQEFIDALKVPVIWLDHHEPQKRLNVKYVNPRNWGENVPPCFMAWQVVGDPKDLWIATVGCVGDWFLPPMQAEFQQKYPDLMPQLYDKPEDIMFNTPVGELVRVISFNLKGRTDDALTSVKVLSRIESPYEILKQSTPRGNFLWKKYLKVKQGYDAIKAQVIRYVKPDDPFLIHSYTEDQMAVTKDLANELTYLYPNKVVILAREKNGEMKCAMRSGRDGPILSKALEKILPTLPPGNTGGGHEHACGANIMKDDFEEFVRRMREECAAKV
ncbi:DHH family phosphoesterase [Candidatus Woesearchaeota archaeon]|nr:DHH family phosphoesterase [Candidatus Woesearchaeota archaeon]